MSWSIMSGLREFKQKYGSTLVYCVCSIEKIQYHGLDDALWLCNFWSMFVNHKWIHMQEALVLDMYHELVCDPNDQPTRNHELTMLQDAFVDNGFIDKLNANHSLICFNNGVYDVKNRTFRIGHPHDYCTLCTGYDYMKYEAGGDTANDINASIAYFCPNPDDRSIFLEKIANMFTIDKYHRSDIIYGEIGTKKNILLELIGSMLGSYMSYSYEHRVSKVILCVHDLEYDFNLKHFDRSINMSGQQELVNQRSNNLVIIDHDNVPLPVCDISKYVRNMICLEENSAFNTKIMCIVPMFMDLILEHIDDTTIFESMKHMKSARSS